MGYNKLAAYRYRLIDFCLQNRQRRWTIDDLREYISRRLDEEFDRPTGLGERQLLYDFALMRKDPPEGYGAPIVRKNGFVFYRDPDFSISKVPLSNHDLERFRAALHLLRPFDELPYFEELHILLRKLEGRREETRPGSQRTAIQFEKNNLLRGRHWLASLFDLILEKKPASVIYQPYYMEQGVEVVFHPYLLKEYNSRWFVLGWNEGEGAVWNLALDRMLSVEPLLQHPFRPNETLDPDRYFEDIIGVTLPENMEKTPVRLLFSPGRAPYVLTKPLHHSQTTIQTRPDGWVELEICVIPNQELCSLLLSFGPDCKVLAPLSLKENIARLLKNASEMYL